MKTDYIVYLPGGQVEVGVKDLPEQPSLDELYAITKPYIKGWLEHVSVNFGGARDMFVDEEGLLLGLPFNRFATEIYHAAAIGRGISPHVLSPVVGPAILFPKRRVWF